VHEKEISPTAQKCLGSWSTDYVKRDLKLIFNARGKLRLKKGPGSGDREEAEKLRSARNESKFKAGLKTSEAKTRDGRPEDERKSKDAAPYQEVFFNNLQKVVNIQRT
jgi:hypothetical protein